MIRNENHRTGGSVHRSGSRYYVIVIDVITILESEMNRDVLMYMTTDQIKDQISKLDTMSKEELIGIVKGLWDVVEEQSGTIDRLRDDLDSIEKGLVGPER